MNTIAYVDGYNLFYGCLKGTNFKWLDVHALMNDLIVARAPSASLIRTKYFTTRVLPRFSEHGVESERAQNAYIRALQHHPNVDVSIGRYNHSAVSAMRYCKPPQPNNRVKVYRLEEKETDVCLALSMYRDLAKQSADQVVLVSNDSDMAPALRMMKEDFPAAKIGLIIPALSGRVGNEKRQVTHFLSQHADWICGDITIDELARAQLPDRVKAGRKPADRPALWSYPLLTYVPTP